MPTATRRTGGVTVVRSAVALIFSTVASSALGLLFWFVGARLYSADELGRAAAAVSAITLLSGVAQMSLSTVLVRFLPTAGAATGRMLTQSQAAVASVSVILAGGFWLLGLGDAFLPTGPWAFLLFCACVASVTLAALHDGAFTGLGRARWVPGRTVAFSAARVVLLVVLAGGGAAAPVLLGWSLPTIAVTAVTCVVLLSRVMRDSGTAAPQALPTRRELVHFAGSQYLSGTVAAFSNYAPPVIVAAVLGPTVNGTSFYIPWLVATVAGAMAWNVSVSLVVAVAKDPGGARQHLWHAVRLLLALSVGGGAALVLGAGFLLGLLGPEYAEGGTAALRLIGVTLPFVAFGMLYSAAAIINKRTWPVFWLGLASTVTFLGGAYWSLDRSGVTGVAWAYLLVEGTVALAIVPATLRHLRAIVAEGDAAATPATRPAPAARGVAAVPRLSPFTDTGSMTVIFMPAEVSEWLAKAETARFTRIPDEPQPAAPRPDAGEGTPDTVDSTVRLPRTRKPARRHAAPEDA